MKIEVINNYVTDENTYIVYENEEAVVIDPGNSADLIIEKCGSLGVEIKNIIITHCHYDHIEFLEELREKTDAKLISSKNASINIGDENINLSVHGLGYKMLSEKSDIIMEDGEERNISGINFKCIYTPGHTNCSACFVAGNNIFTGDTLFLRSIGRSDLPTGNSEELINSIKTKLYKLNDDVKCFCGHGGATSIGYEKKFNFYVKG